MTTHQDIKALFFDIDGTLVSFSTHEVPQSTIAALTEAHRRGTKIFISTGRPPGFITNLGAISHLIDGYITTNGAYCFVGSHAVSRHAMDAADVEAVLSDAIEQNYPVVVDAEQTIVVYNNGPLVDEIYVKGLGVDVLDYSLTLDDLHGQAIMQLSPFCTVEQEAALAPRLHNTTSGRWHPQFTDLTRRGVDKALGLKEMAHHLGICLDQTMAFGDGGNDIPILQTAGIGVAMGNAAPEVKQAADYVTTHIDLDGISHALEHYHLV